MTQSKRYFTADILGRQASSPEDDLYKVYLKVRASFIILHSECQTNRQTVCVYL